MCSDDNCIPRLPNRASLVFPLVNISVMSLMIFHEKRRYDVVCHHRSLHLEFCEILSYKILFYKALLHTSVIFCQNFAKYVIFNFPTSLNF